MSQILRITAVFAFLLGSSWAGAAEAARPSAPPQPPEKWEELLNWKNRWKSQIYKLGTSAVTTAPPDAFKSDQHFKNALDHAADAPPSPSTKLLNDSCESSKNSDCRKICKSSYQSAYQKSLLGETAETQLSALRKFEFYGTRGNLPACPASQLDATGGPSQCCTQGDADAKATFHKLFEDANRGLSDQKQGLKGLPMCSLDYRTGRNYGFKHCSCKENELADTRIFCDGEPLAKIAACYTHGYFEGLLNCKANCYQNESLKDRSELLKADWRQKLFGSERTTKTLPGTGNDSGHSGNTRGKHAK